jgi:hypothetical protein
MNKLGIVLATVISSASSVALAAPSPVLAPIDRPVAQAYGHHHWMMLGSGKLSMRGRRAIEVTSNARFAELRLAANGPMFVEKLDITYGNGKTQCIELNKRLGRGEQSLTVDLEGRTRKVEKVVVYGRGTRAGFELLGK